MQTVRPSDFEEAPIEFSDEAICLSKAFQQEPDIQQASCLQGDCGRGRIIMCFVSVSVADLIHLAAKLGFNLLLDRSGKLLMKKKGVYKKDIVMNPRAAWCMLVMFG